MSRDGYSTRLHLLLFLATVITTTLAGAEWTTNASLFSERNPLSWDDFLLGFHFSIPLLLVLSIHEFGHYFTARYHGVSVTLPFYIPLWTGFIGMPSIGTLGAFIRIRSRIQNRKQYFDIGASGPLAGFLAALIVLIYGFLTLPPPEHIFSIHPEYLPYGWEYPSHVYQGTGFYLSFGPNLLFDWLGELLAKPLFMPHPYEMVHYPYLLAGYLSLFFTALNLLPIGQLDGGHVLYAVFGKRAHHHFSRIFLVFLIFYAGLGLLTELKKIGYLLLGLPLYAIFLYFSLKSLSPLRARKWTWVLVILALQLLVSWLLPSIEGYSGWLLFAFVLGYFIGVDHPGPESRPLDGIRLFLACLVWMVFLLCFTPQPFITS